MAVLSLASTTPYTITYKISDMTPQYVYTAKIELYKSGNTSSPIKTATYRAIDVMHLETLFGYFTGLEPETHYIVHSYIYDANGHETSNRQDSIQTEALFKGCLNTVVHSLNISTKDDVFNTFENWGLVPAERPSIAPPELKTSYIDIPYADGTLDYTELLVGKTPFGRRTGSWRFYTDEVKMKSLGLTWKLLYDKIESLIHGVECEVSLDDESDFYYTGRLSLNQWRSLQAFSEITIDYNLESYKCSRVTSADVDWQWDVALGDPDFTILYGEYASQEYKVINFINNGGQETTPTYHTSADVEVKMNFGDLISEILLGQWGIGQDRFDRLTAAGYCWQIVQNAVNEAIGSDYRYPVPPDAMTPKTQQAINDGELNTGDTFTLIEGDNVNTNLALKPGNNVAYYSGNADVVAVYREHYA